MSIINKRMHTLSEYYLAPTRVEVVHLMKYLGFIIDNKLKWSDSVKAITIRANFIPGSFTE